MKKFTLLLTLIAANMFASVALAQPAKTAPVAPPVPVAAPATATATAPAEGATREDIIKSQLKFQTESTKKIAQMSERLEQAKTIQSMSQSQLISNIK